MAETSFTPGPWKVTDEPTDTELSYNVESEPADWVVARVWADVAELSSTGQAEANARLIAAAPEMYAALLLVAKLFAVQGTNTAAEVLLSNTVHEAIAKAVRP